MNKNKFRIAHFATVLEEAIANINKSIIIDRFLLQKAKHIADNLQVFVSLNDSGNDIMQKIMKLQKLIEKKLHYVEEARQKFENFYKKSNPEKTWQEMNPLNGYEELEE